MALPYYFYQRVLFFVLSYFYAGLYFALGADDHEAAVGIFCAAGPKACVLEYSIDGAPYKKIDTYTEWSSGLYIPWVYMFEKKLENKSHTLKLRIPKGERTECVIRDFVVNQPE